MPDLFASAATLVKPSENGRIVAKITETIVHRKNPLLGLDLHIFSSRKDSALKPVQLMGTYRLMVLKPKPVAIHL